jgi:hypothetical protein
VQSASPYKSLANEIGELVVKSVQGFGRLGKNPDKEKMDIADSTVKMHQYLKRYGNAGQFYGDKKALNISGQLLNSIAYFFNDVKNTLTIRPTGDRTPYKGKSGNLQLGISSNNELMKVLQEDKGFKIFFLSTTVKKAIVSRIRSYYRRYLKN